MLFEGAYLSTNNRGSFYDVSLDGQQFLMITFAESVIEGESPQIIIVENWFEELERLAPTAE